MSIRYYYFLSIYHCQFLNFGLWNFIDKAGERRASFANTNCRRDINQILLVPASITMTWSAIKPFHATGLFRYPLKTSEYQRFFVVFRRYRKRALTWNGLKKNCTVLLYFFELSQVWCELMNFYPPVGFLMISGRIGVH